MRKVAINLGLVILTVWSVSALANIENKEGAKQTPKTTVVSHRPVAKQSASVKSTAHKHHAHTVSQGQNKGQSLRLASLSKEEQKALQQKKAKAAAKSKAKSQPKKHTSSAKTATKKTAQVKKATSVKKAAKPKKAMRLKKTRRPVAPKLTVVEAVRHTLRTNPSVLEQRFQERAAKHRVGQARSGFLPTLDVRVSVGNEKANSSSTSFVREDKPTRTVEFSMSQLLWDNLKTYHQLVARENEHDVQRYTVRETEQITALDATQSYLDVLRLRRLRAIALSNIRAHDATLRKVKARFERGISSLSSVHLAEKRLTRAREALLNTENLLSNSLVNFSSIIALPSNNVVLPSAISVPTRLHDAQRVMQGKSPVLQVARHQLHLARENVRAVESDFFPTFSLRGAYTSRRNISGVDGINKSASVNLDMSYNIFNGGADMRRLDTNKALYYAAMDGVARAKREVDSQLQQVWHNLKTSEKLELSLMRRVKQARRVLADFNKQYLLGKQSLFNLLEMEEELFEAKAEYTNNRYAMLNARYQLHAIMGDLTEVLGV